MLPKPQYNGMSWFFWQWNYSCCWFECLLTFSVYSVMIFVSSPSISSDSVSKIFFLKFLNTQDTSFHLCSLALGGKKKFFMFKHSNLIVLWLKLLIQHWDNSDLIFDNTYKTSFAVCLSPSVADDKYCTSLHLKQHWQLRLYKCRNL